MLMLFTELTISFSPITIECEGKTFIRNSNKFALSLRLHTHIFASQILPIKPLSNNVRHFQYSVDIAV